MRGSRGAVLRHSVWVRVVVVAVAACDPFVGPVLPPEELRLEAVTATMLTGTVGENVTPVPIVRVTTLSGTPAPGIEIAFAVWGGGAIATPAARTDSDGRATAGTWTLGPGTGAHTITARASGVADVVFTAMAVAGPAAGITRVSGDSQMGLTDAALPKPLRVRVTDRFGNPVPQAPVTFAVISGDGVIDSSLSVADLVGIATSGAWTLGAASGIQQVKATAGNAEVVFRAFACDDVCRRGQVVFVRDDGIYILLDGRARRLIGGVREAAPAWSPDGQRVAFVRYDQNWVPNVYIMDADGSNVVHRGTGFNSPAWSPDGRTLAVDTGPGGYYGDIYLLSVEDSTRAPVHIATYAAQPAWSPDGTEIAFVQLSGDDGYHTLVVMNADGSNQRPVLPGDEGAIDHPTWSPTGQRIAFAKCINGTCAIHATNADGSDHVQLTTGKTARSPAWSPDGTGIAFTAWDTFGDPNTQSIAYIAADGSGTPVPMVSPGHSPAWRP